MPIQPPLPLPRAPVTPRTIRSTISGSVPPTPHWPCMFSPSRPRGLRYSKSPWRVCHLESSARPPTGRPPRSSGRPCASNRSGRTSIPSSESSESGLSSLRVRRRVIMGRFELGSEPRLSRLLVATLRSSPWAMAESSSSASGSSCPLLLLSPAVLCASCSAWCFRSVREDCGESGVKATDLLAAWGESSESDSGSGAKPRFVSRDAFGGFTP